jgi:hypothetical protein
MQEGMIWYRYRVANNGVWISEDPLDEDGGVNLYAFVENNPLDNADIYGMSVWDFGIDVGETYKYWERVAVGGFQNIRGGAYFTGGAQLGIATGMFGLLEALQLGAIDTEFEDAANNIYSPFSSCKRLGYVQFAKGLELGISDATLYSGIGTFGRVVAPRLTYQSIFKVNSPWKRIGQRKVYRDWREEFRLANNLEPGEVDLDHWLIEKEIGWENVFPVG